jgi:hypothetical protein
MTGDNRNFWKNEREFFLQKGLDTRINISVFQLMKIMTLCLPQWRRCILRFRLDLFFPPLRAPFFEAVEVTLVIRQAREPFDAKQLQIKNLAAGLPKTQCRKCPAIVRQHSIGLANYVRADRELQ